jgi:hypothetical protein
MERRRNVEEKGKSGERQEKKVTRIKYHPRLPCPSTVLSHSMSNRQICKNTNVMCLMNFCFIRITKREISFSEITFYLTEMKIFFFVVG